VEGAGRPGTRTRVLSDRRGLGVRSVALARDHRDLPSGSDKWGSAGQSDAGRGEGTAGCPRRLGLVARRRVWLCTVRVAQVGRGRSWDAFCPGSDTRLTKCRPTLTGSRRRVGTRSGRSLRGRRRWSEDSCCRAGCHGPAPKRARHLACEGPAHRAGPCCAAASSRVREEGCRSARTTTGTHQGITSSS
jgi:hypothetical protein